MRRDRGEADRAINAGNPPDAFLSFGVDNVGRFCDTGAWVDLNPYIDGRGGLRPEQLPGAAALTYTSFDGKQCSLPFLTDTTGLYYNLDLFEKAGLSEPPKTTDELTEYAKALTEFNPDGSIEVAGFVPVTDYYCCSSNLLNLGHMFGRDLPRRAGRHRPTRPTPRGPRCSSGSTTSSRGLRR